MAVGDKLVTLDGLKAVYQDLNGNIDGVKSAVGGESVILHPTDETVYAGNWVADASTLIMQLSNSDSYSTIEHPIDISGLKVGTEVSIKSSVTGNYGVYIFGANYKRLAYVNGYNTAEHGYSPDTNARLITLTVPEGAAYIVSSIKNNKLSGISDFDVYGTTKNNIDRLEDEVAASAKATDIDRLEAEIAASEEVTEKEIPLTGWEWEDGYVNRNDVVGNDTNFKHTGYIDIRPYKKIRIDGLLLSGSSGAAIVMMNADRTSAVTFFSNHSSQQGGDHYIDADIASEGVPVPEGAVWMRASQRSNALVNYAIYGIIDYAETAIKLTKADPYPELPCTNIIRDGGFCKIFEKIGVVGDSLSSGGMTPPDADVTEEEAAEVNTDMMYYSWIQYMARYSGLTAYNFSMSGLSAKSLRYGQSNTNVQDIITRLTGTDYKCKAYFVALGHNDKNYASNHPEYVIGTTADCDLANPSNNADTFCGNYAWVISQIKSVQPRAKIFLVGMKSTEVFGDYNAAIASMVTLFNTYYDNTDVYYLDMAQYAPPLDSWEYTNGHGNAMGYLNYSYQISSYVDYIIRNNKSDFKLVQFIGSPYVQ